MFGFFMQGIEMAEIVVENGVVDKSQADICDADSSLANEIVHSTKESQQAIEQSAPSQHSAAADFEEVNLGSSSASLEAASQPVVDGALAANCDADASLAGHTVLPAEESQRSIDHSALSHQSKVSTVPSNCPSQSCEPSMQPVLSATHGTLSGQ